VVRGNPTGRELAAALVALRASGEAASGEAANWSASEASAWVGRERLRHRRLPLVSPDAWRSIRDR